MAFKGRYPVRTKIVIDNKIIKEVNLCNYLGNMISYRKELDIDNKLYNYMNITGILNNVFRPQKPLKKTRIKLLYAFFWVIPGRLNFVCRHFGTLCLFHLHNPEESIQHSEHGESLKSRIKLYNTLALPGLLYGREI